MKSLVVVVFAGFLAYSAPAFAQNAGEPGATGTGGSLSGSNTGTGSTNEMSSGSHMMMSHHHHHRRYHHHAM